MDQSKTIKREPPAGQPRAQPRVKVVRQEGTGTELPTFVYPHEIVNVRSKKLLDEYLEHFSHPMPMLPGSWHHKSTFSMRRMIEWVFPALRWFCKVYNTPVPRWLEGNGWAEGMSKEDFVRIFGDDKPLHPIEWKEDPKHAGKRF